MSAELYTGTINVTGGTFNITADASESTSGYNAGIEAAGTCSLTVTAAHFNVSAKGGTLGAAVMLGRDVDAERRSSGISDRA